MMIYTASTISDGTLAWTYEAPSSTAFYDLPIVTDDAVYLFNAVLMIYTA